MHESFCARIPQWLERLTNASSSVHTIGAEILNYLRTWLLSHFRVQDMRYIAHIRSQGAAPPLTRLHTPL